ncbi:radiation insensitive 1 [Dermatophagoides pteronyssinus]|uniref:radiation insensitive 1 n=1 Tax=Dermatophagoides pteronyssinus TaxID=6956 RepID=UPI003F67D604
MSSNNTSEFSSTQESQQSSSSPQRITLFSGEIQNTKFLSPVLKSINIDKFIQIIVTECGIKFICENYQTIQATTFIDRNLFVKYHMENEKTPQTIRILTTELLHVLSFLLTKQSNRYQQQQQQQSKSSLIIKYDNDKRLKLKIISNDRLFKSSIQTLDTININVWTMAFVNRITLDASVLKDFWKFANTNADSISIEMNNDEPWFLMSTKSQFREFSQQIDASSTHIEHYECTVPSINHYQMKSIKYTVRPLMLADKINIRFSSAGLLNMQFFISIDSVIDDSHFDDGDGLQQQQQQQRQIIHSTTTASDSQRCFVEFFIIPII